MAAAVKPARQWLPWAGLGFFGGCLFSPAFYVASPYAAALLGGILLTAVLGLVLLCRGGKRAAVAAVLVFFMLGLLRSGAQQALPVPQSESYSVSGYVSGAVKQRADGGLSFALRKVRLNGTAAAGTAYCTYHPSSPSDEPLPSLYDGALVTLPARVYAFGPRTGAVHRDMRSWALQNGYRYGLASYGGLAVLNTQADAPVMDAAYRVRCAVEQRLTTLMGRYADKAQWMMALLFGDRSGVESEALQAFQTLGIAHIISVSGLHVSLLAALLWQVLFSLRIPEKRLVPILAVLLWLYTALCGFSAACVRAAVMTMVYRYSRLRGRAYRPFCAMALAALIILFINPAQASASGFLLSFTVTTVIFLVQPPLRAFLQNRVPHCVWRRGHPVNNAVAEVQYHFRGILALAVAAQLGALLPTALYFHRLPVYGLFMNVLLVPLVSMVLMPLFAVTALLCFVPIVGHGLAALSILGMQGLLWAVQGLAQLPNAVIRVGSPCTLLLLCSAAALFALRGGLYRGRLRRGVLCALCLLVGLSAQLWPNTPALRFVQTASGQSDAAILMDGDKTLVLDTGSDGYEVLDYLEAECRSVDALVITHLHLDHVGGVPTLLAHGIPIRHCYLPYGATRAKVDAQAMQILQSLADAGVPITELSAGDTLQLNAASLQVLWPVAEAVDRIAEAGTVSANVYSLATATDFGGYTLLSAADTTDAYDRYWAQPCDVLKVAHHGASDSTSAAFLQTAQPRAALFTCRSNARLPAADAVRRVADAGAALLRTDRCGDITLTVQNGQLHLTPYCHYREEALP